jgi:hypothetical protein
MEILPTEALIRVHGALDIIDNGAEEILSGQSEDTLQRIEIVDIDNVPWRQVAFPVCENVKELSLCNCGELTDKGLQNMLDAFPSLNKVCQRHCS